ncbi:MAG: serine hydrolase domain-containing protein [Cyclobacteriaceae bacterium]
MKNLPLLAVLVVTSCLPSEKATSVEALQMRIDSLFNSEIQSDGPGAALLISYDNKPIISKGYGLKDLETREPISSGTNMRMASVSKQFTALAVLNLVDKGLLSIDDPVSEYLPYPVFEEITIEHLLNHTSGIADYEEAFMNEWDTTQIAQNKDVLDWYAMNPSTNFSPGEKWEYSNGAYNLLATIVEKVSGEDFSKYAQDMVFKKAGMTTTNFFNLAKPIDIKERASCYEKDDSGEWKKVDGNFLNGCIGEGAVYTNLIDFLAYDSALREKSLVSASTHNLIFNPSSMAIEIDFPFVFSEGSEVYYGMGQFVTHDYAFHGGGWYGTRTFVYREFERPLTIAIFMNSDRDFVQLMNSTYEIANEFFESI